MRTLWAVVACEAITHVLDDEPMPDGLYEELCQAAERQPDTDRFVQWIQEAITAWGLN